MFENSLNAQCFYDTYKSNLREYENKYMKNYLESAWLLIDLTLQGKSITDYSALAGAILCTNRHW